MCLPIHTLIRQLVKKYFQDFIWIITYLLKTEVNIIVLKTVKKLLAMIESTSVKCALPWIRYIDTLVGSRSELSRGRPARAPVPMLQNKTEPEAMVTKKKSKIPCLSLSSFLPALEGTHISADLYFHGLAANGCDCVHPSRCTHFLVLVRCNVTILV